MKYLVSENTIMWAFRYALGRKTGAVIDVCDTLKEHWENLSSFTQDQIQCEIKSAIINNRAGMSCDVEQWKKILKLPVFKDSEENQL